MHLDSPDLTDRTIFIDTGKVGSTGFALPEEDQNMLYGNGRTAAKKFLDGVGTYRAWNFKSA
ncbi:hypothetical protein B2J88_24485 [Rhodococcus sp. SRB_17]|nr:hypothetical protein [Rhodococcus sp. SRB_17]